MIIGPKKYNEPNERGLYETQTQKQTGHMIYVDFDNVKLIKNDKLTTKPYSKPEFLEDTVEIGISLYGNIWEIKDKRVECNEEIIALHYDETKRPELKTGTEIETVETFPDKNEGKKVKSGVIVKVARITESELEKLRSVLEKLRKAYGYIRLEKNITSGGFNILGLKDGEYELVGELSSKGTIMYYSYISETAYKQNKEELDAEINADINSLFGHIPSQDDISNFLRFMLEDICHIQQKDSKDLNYKDSYEKYLKEAPLSKDEYNDSKKIKDFDKSKIYNEDFLL